MKKPTRKPKPPSAVVGWVPTPPQLEQAPELAILAVLECALETASSALLAVYPEFCDMEPREPLSQPALGALTIISAGKRLHTSIAGYRGAIEREQKKSSAQIKTEEIPF